MVVFVYPPECPDYRCFPYHLQSQADVSQLKKMNGFFICVMAKQIQSLG